MVANVNSAAMGDDENRSKLFDQIRQFSQRKLKKVETKVTTGSGEHVVEKRDAKGLKTLKSDGIKGPGYVVDTKPDLQVGMIIPGLFIASQDVAQDKSLLDSYEITHILNLAYGVENAFEDDFNYKRLDILDEPSTDITQYFDECYDFIDEGCQRGNCLVHCNAGVSRSTAICCAFLMKKQKMKYKEALALVREARAFARPNDGFAKQLEDYNDRLFGQFEAPDTNEDAFIAKQRAQREAEKAAISGTVSVKNRLNKFGDQLNSIFANRVQGQPIKLPLKKKAALPQQSTPIFNSNAPPPPPPPPCLNAPAPPPPPPPMTNNKLPTPNKKIETPNKFTKQPEPPKVTKVEPHKFDKPGPKKLGTYQKATPEQPPKPVESVPNEYQKSENPNVDETEIKVAAQRKLWESAMQQNNHVNNNHVVPKVQTTPATPNNVNKAKFSWQQSQQPPQTVATTTASPEPEKKSKKIIIKPRKDSLLNEEPRRSTRDLVEAIEAVNSASNSQSSTPYSSPGLPRRQMQYGRRSQTTQIDKAQPQVTPKAKPAWGLRETVDSLAESGGASPQMTPRSRSPMAHSITSTPRESHSPSPSRNSADSDASNTSSSRPKVFGRVPPRKMSLSGGNAPSNKSNDFPVVPCAPSSSSTNSVAPPLPSVTASKFSNKKESPAFTSSATVKPSAAVNEKVEKSQVKSNAQSAPASQPESSTANDSSNGLRAGFKRVPLGETKEKSVNRSVEARRNKSGLNRSSTKEILKLIKTKSRADFGRSMETVDEDIEIDYLLTELEKEGLDGIDWDQIGVDEDEVKNIVETNREEGGGDEEEEDESSEEESSSSEEESSSEESSEEEEMHHTVFSKPSPASVTSAATENKQPVKQVSAMAIKLAPAPPKSAAKLEVEEESSSEEEESEEEESEEETDSD